MIQANNIYLGDCLDIMKDIPDGSIDLILTDPPFGTTECKWDTVVDEIKLFDNYKRILTPTGSIVMTVAFPFGTSMIYNNMDLFKYDCVWLKSNVTGFANAKNKPMRKHENILVFSKGTTANGSKRKMTYNPQGLIKVDKQITYSRRQEANLGIGSNYNGNKYTQEYTNYPNTIITASKEYKSVHPTQKPVALFEYLIKTYTNDGETVLDPFAGSGTTGVACKNLNRNYILIEKEEKYFNIIKDRLER